VSKGLIIVSSFRDLIEDGVYIVIGLSAVSRLVSSPDRQTVLSVMVVFFSPVEYAPQFEDKTFKSYAQTGILSSSTD